VKSFYKNLKPGDFTVAEGHGHPLVKFEGSMNLCFDSSYLVGTYGMISFVTFLRQVIVWAKNLSLEPIVRAWDGKMSFPLLTCK
jgi:hypothetical protein